ncbi:hypothetical protein Thicy_0473 [Thiomicrospira cyclica ALM1]|uniref:STAS domain-containing protein n=1 Tax=Thiomicrospira cyclica (strain DSM 14477 / JCM 11371 / ALM1) TaxID=717773 RepID=F6DBD8_THICA|nr:hypothetical protein Thicy_0473 [Thiomicrospira cyclica ALM1]
MQLAGQMTIESLNEQVSLQVWFQKPSLPFNAVDLAAVDQIDSAGLACLVCWMELSPNLKIQRIPAAALELAELYNLNGYLSDFGQARS